jgi:cystathionine gamma-synthase
MTLRRATIAAQANGTASPAGGVVGAIETATTFLRDADYSPASDVYRRDHNPTVREAEAVIAALEGAAEARLFASGLAAISAVLRAASGPIALQSGTYYGTAELGRLYGEQGRDIIPFEGGDLASLERAMARRPGLVVVETPSNPWLTVVDIAAAAAIAHAAGALLAVDSTAATPMVTRPLEHGADIVMHSATKALNGHSDVLAGALAVREPDGPLWTRAKALRAKEGAVLSPFDAFLLVRGMRTLALRVEAMNRSALHVAHWLAAHPKVAVVRYPGLPAHPGHATALRQMEGFGGLLSFDVHGGAREARAVLSGLSVVKRATSLGGVETLIEHRHSIEPAFTQMPPGLLRLSVGIEAVEDIVADLDRGLSTVA